MKTGYSYRTGMELTAIPKDRRVFKFKKSEYLRGESASLLDAMAIMVRHELKKKWKKIDAGREAVDGHCLEIQSPSMPNKQKALEFYADFDRLSRAGGFIPQHPDVVCGGFHLHFSVSQMAISKILSRHTTNHKLGAPDSRMIKRVKRETRKVFSIYQKLMRECIGHYTVPWVFLHPDDVDSGNNDLLTNSSFVVANENGERQKIMDQIKESNGHLDARNIFQLIVFPDPKHTLFKYEKPRYNGESELQSVLRDCYTTKQNWFTFNTNEHHRVPTFEFRCFEMPETPEQFLRQYEFGEALFNYVLNLPEDYYPEVEFMSKSVFHQLTFEYCRDKFNALLVKIGLDPKVYECDVERNMKPRFAKGYVRQ